MGRFVSSAILNAPALISLDWCNWVLFTALTRNWIGIFLLKIVAQEADHWKHWPFISVWNQVLAHPVSALLFSSCLLSQWLLLALVVVVSTFHSSHIKVAQTEDGDAFIFSPAAPPPPLLWPHCETCRPKVRGVHKFFWSLWKETLSGARWRTVVTTWITMFFLIRALRWNYKQAADADRLSSQIPCDHELRALVF